MDVETRVSELNTFLVRNGTASLFLILLKSGFGTPLEFAIDGGHSDIAVELINAGAMLQVTDTVMFFLTTCL